MDIIESIITTRLETINPTMNVLSALKKLPSRSGEGIYGGSGVARTPIDTGPLLAFDLSSVESYLHSGKVTHAQGCTSKFQRL